MHKHSSLFSESLCFGSLNNFRFIAIKLFYMYLFSQFKEILLYLLDHFKRLTNNCEVNKMDTQNLATCLAPILFYPSPSSARNLDPNILEPRKMAEIFKFILEIWPDDRSKSYKFNPAESWPSPYSSNPPLPEDQHPTGFHPQQQQHHHHPKHRYDQSSHRASSAIRSTISGPAGTGLGYRSPHTVQRSSILASKAESGNFLVLLSALRKISCFRQLSLFKLGCDCHCGFLVSFLTFTGSEFPKMLVIWQCDLCVLYETVCL